MMFTEKLNKLKSGVHSIEEKIAMTDGVWEGYLKHDNIVKGSIAVYTEPKLEGIKVTNFYTSYRENEEWKTYIRILSNVPELYVSYESEGDQVEAEDINELQDILSQEVNRSTDKDEALERKLIRKVDKVEGKGLSDENYTLEEKTKLAGVESGANKYTHPNKHPASIITETPSRRFVSDAEKDKWNEPSIPSSGLTCSELRGF